MNWLDKCESTLTSAHIFLSHSHLARFASAFHTLKQQPFVSKGLCKCAFLSAWDQQHFDIFMDMVEQMIANNETNLDRMILAGEEHIRNAKSNEKILYSLSQEFLLHPDSTPSESFILELSSAWIPIGDSTLEASYIIDQL